jgi:hypothetical protein
MSPWSDVFQLIDDVVAAGGATFSPATIQNARDVAALGALRAFPMPDLSKGYWETICFHWTDIEVEVFDDRVELYDFADRGMDIRHYAHKPGSDLDPEFVTRLSDLVIRTS